MSEASEQAPDPFAAELTALRGTLAELREQRQAWERDVTALFDEFDALAVKVTLDSSNDDRKAAQSAVDECRLELAEQSESLARHQKSTEQELLTMCEMIEQQTELLAAFIGAATQFSLPPGPPNGDAKYDPVASGPGGIAQLHKSSVGDRGSGAGRSAVVQSS